MVRQNSQGQILTEVALVMFFIVLILFAVLNRLTHLKPQHYKYQMTQESPNEKVPRYRIQK